LPQVEGPTFAKDEWIFTGIIIHNKRDCKFYVKITETVFTN
jgi:hypothetical protein